MKYWNLFIDLVAGSILFYLFYKLKTQGKIPWSWWIVTAPIWIPLIGVNK